MEDVFLEIKTRMTSLAESDDFSSVACLNNFLFLSKVRDKVIADGNFAAEIGPYLTELNFVELFQKLWQKHFGEELFALGNKDVLWMVLELSRRVMWTMSDRSTDICERIIQIGVHSDLVGYINSESLKPNRLKETARQEMVKSILSILHNVVQKAAGAPEALRACDTVNSIQPFRESEQRVISCVALMIQSYLVTEEENEKINSDIEMFKLLVDILDASIKGFSRHNVKFSVMEALEAMNKLAANDMNKERIVQAGALPYYVVLLQPDRPMEEQKEAAHGLWILGFKCKEHIQKQDGCTDGTIFK